MHVHTVGQNIIQVITGRTPLNGFACNVAGCYNRSNDITIDELPVAVSKSGRKR